MAYERLVITTRTLPQAPTGKTELAGSQRMIRNHSTIAKTIKCSDLSLAAFAPGNINPLRRENDVFGQVATEQPVHDVGPKGSVGVGGYHPVGFRPANTHVLGMKIQQRYFRVFAQGLMSFRSHHVSPQRLKSPGEIE